MTRDPEREARQRAAEWALQHGEVVLDTPEVTCAKLGHTWTEPVCNDGVPTAYYSRGCHRCGRVETAVQPAGPWEWLVGVAP
jgi:hypothetical protein